MCHLSLVCDGSRNLVDVCSKGQADSETSNLIIKLELVELQQP